jgi:hypothetical protein
MKVKGFIFFLLCFIFFTGCISYYKIDDRVSRDLSMLVMRFNISDDFRIIEASIRDQAGKIYRSSYRGQFGSELKNKLIIFSNIPAGKYRLEYFYSMNDPSSRGSSDGLYTSWMEMNLNFLDKSDQGFWIDVKPGSVIYAGKILWGFSVQETKFMEDVAEQEKVALTNALFGKLYDVDMQYNTQDGKKIYTGFVYQYDHPEIVGKQKYLKLQKAIFSYIRRDEMIPKWYPVIDKQLKEIELELKETK